MPSSVASPVPALGGSGFDGPPAEGGSGPPGMPGTFGTVTTGG